MVLPTSFPNGYWHGGEPVLCHRAVCDARGKMEKQICCNQEERMGMRNSLFPNYKLTVTVQMTVRYKCFMFKVNISRGGVIKV